jgi:hypothetical protein
VKADFDLRYISLGAGVQSTAMYLMAVEGELTPMPDFAVFADTQSEPAGVYEHLEWLRDTFGHIIPIHRPSKGSLRDAITNATDPNARNRRFASVPFWVEGKDGREAPGARQCTAEYKIDVIRRFVREQLGLSKGERAAGKYRVECWIGISVDEATRAKISRDSWIENRWPLLYDKPMRRGDCLDWMESQGYPRPSRSACTFCPYRGISEWRQMRQDDPASFEDACSVDEMIRVNGTMKGMVNEQFVHRSLRPLREVIEDPNYEDRQINLFENECEGLCGV